MGSLQRRNVKGFYAVTSNSVPLDHGKTVFNLVSQTDPLSNVVYTRTKEKRSFFSSTIIFDGDQLSVNIDEGLTEDTSWAPFNINIHKTVEMLEIADHTKERIDANKRDSTETQLSKR